jgi:hypothetical protein
MRLLALGVLIISVGCSELTDQAGEESVVLTSPNERVKVELAWQDGLSPTYQVSLDNEALIQPSALDLAVEGQEKVEHDLVIIAETTVNERESLPWGQFSEVKNHYQGITLKLINKATQQQISTVEFRLFDDAVAFRYLFDDSELTQQMVTESTQFNFAQDAKSWSYNGMQPNKQVPSIIHSHNEQLHVPILLEGDNSPALALQEASRLDAAMISFVTQKDKASFVVVSEPISMTNPPVATSWRVLQIGATSGDLLTSQTLINLAPKSKIADTSWIKTGKSFWDWRVRGEQYDDHTYALDNESLRRMIDFSAANNMQYVMIDANWYGPEHDVNSDPFTEIDGLNIRNLIKQANNKGIGFILYLNDKASVNHDLDQLFETWSSWGAAGVKYGFMKLDGEEKVRKTIKIVELAAKHKLLINFHDRPIVPSGLRKTWPNWVTREAVHAQADGHHTFRPSGFVQMAHVNALAGPLDMSNGFFKLNGLKQSRDYVRDEVYSTVAGEVARSLIIFSGLIIFPDSPEEYERKSDLFEFLKAMPTSWDESKVLTSNINSHIVTARRSNEQWFVGAAINEEGGAIPLKLDFLSPNQLYMAHIFSDAADAHYKTNREAYKTENVRVKQGDELIMTLAPGGGQAIWFTPLKEGGQ